MNGDTLPIRSHKGVMNDASSRPSLSERSVATESDNASTRLGTSRSSVATKEASQSQPQTPPKMTKPRGPAWEVLEAQCPNHLECYHCKELHPLGDIRRFDPSSKEYAPSMPCTKVDHKHRTTKFIHPQFHYTVFRMLMKQHRLGGDCAELLQALSYRSSVIIDGTKVKQIIATPRIIGDQLLMRVQTAYVVPPTRPSRLYLANSHHFKCRHSLKYSYWNSNLALDIVERFETLETLPEGRQEILLSLGCDVCRTRFLAGLQRFENQGTMLFITKWLNLGTGLSPLEADMPNCIGSPLLLLLNGLGQTKLKKPFDFMGRVLDPSSSLSLEDRQDQFNSSETDIAQKRRARETTYWKLWGRMLISPHKDAIVMRARQRKAKR